MTKPNNELAIYANFFRVGHNVSEFVLECCQLYEDGEQVQVASRLVITPATARELHFLLQESLSQYDDLLAEQANQHHQPRKGLR